MVALNAAVAVAMVDGPTAGPDRLAQLEHDERVAGDHRLLAGRAHLLEPAGHLSGARDGCLAEADRARSLPHQRYLHARVSRLAEAGRVVE